jgi:predicted nucleic acid-binding protein
LLLAFLLNASGAIAATGTLSRIIDAWRSGTFSVIVSAPILEELERIFQKPYFRRHLTDKQSSRFIKLLQRRAAVSPITVSVHGIATHLEDDLILCWQSAKMGHFFNEEN